MPQYVVDATKVTFVNHGCHGSNNVGPTSPHHESNLEVPAALDDKDKLWETIPPDYLEAELDDQLYLPVRNSDLLMSSESNQFIAAGEEILDNYLTFAGTDGVEFWKYVKSLRRECQGLAGFIEEWETMYKQEKKQSEENFTAATRSSTYNDEEPFRNLNCSNPQDPTTIA